VLAPRLLSCRLTQTRASLRPGGRLDSLTRHGYATPRRARRERFFSPHLACLPARLQPALLYDAPMLA